MLNKGKREREQIDALMDRAAQGDSAAARMLQSAQMKGLLAKYYPEGSVIQSAIETGRYARTRHTLHKLHSMTGTERLNALLGSDGIMPQLEHIHDRDAWLLDQGTTYHRLKMLVEATYRYKVEALTQYIRSHLDDADAIAELRKLMRISQSKELAKYGVPYLQSNDALDWIDKR